MIVNLTCQRGKDDSLKVALNRSICSHKHTLKDPEEPEGTGGRPPSDHSLRDTRYVTEYESTKGTECRKGMVPFLSYESSSYKVDRDLHSHSRQLS